MKKQVIEKLGMLVTAAFGLIAALAWNETIKNIFIVIFGTHETILGMLSYALIITIIAVVVTIQLGKLAEKAN